MMEIFLYNISIECLGDFSMPLTDSFKEKEYTEYFGILQHL